MDISVAYNQWFESIKQKILSARLKAAVAVNAQLLDVYWELGKEITAKQHEAKWGDAILEQLSLDLRISFPAIKGFSKRNLYAIRQWYLFFSAQSEFVPQPVAQIPWGHNRLIIAKIKNIDEALFYAAATLQNGWSREQLEINIGNNYYTTKGKAITNFMATLPAPQSQLAVETLKDPYNFDFLGLQEDALEKEIENAKACYQQACLKYVSNEKMTNQSLRQRFKIEDHNYSIASRIIRDSIEDGLIKEDDPESKSRKYASYIPFWA